MARGRATRKLSKRPVSESSDDNNVMCDDRDDESVISDLSDNIMEDAPVGAGPSGPRRTTTVGSNMGPNNYLDTITMRLNALGCEIGSIAESDAITPYGKSKQASRMLPTVVDVMVPSDHNMRSEHTMRSESHTGSRETMRKQSRSDIYEVDRVLNIDHRRKRFFVSWKGYTSRHNSWITLADVPDDEYRQELAGMIGQVDLRTARLRNNHVYVNMLDSNERNMINPDDYKDHPDYQLLEQLVHSNKFEVIDIIEYSREDDKFLCKVKDGKKTSTRLICVEQISNEPFQQQAAQLRNIAISDSPFLILYARQSSSPETVEMLERMYPETAGMNVSTSIQVQLDEMKKLGTYLKIQNYIAFTEENVSARKNTKKQKRLQLAMSIFRKNMTLMVYDTSRFSRNYETGIEMINHIHTMGGRLITVTPPAHSDQLNGLDTIKDQLRAAEHYSDMLSARGKASVARRRAEGKHVGSTCYGFKIGPNGKLVRNPEQVAIMHVIGMLARGHTHLKVKSEIARLTANPPQDLRMTSAPRCNASRIKDILNAANVKIRGKPVSIDFVMTIVRRLTSRTDAIHMDRGTPFP